jgi:hypothetical protein
MEAKSLVAAEEVLSSKDAKAVGAKAKNAKQAICKKTEAADLPTIERGSGTECTVGLSVPARLCLALVLVV